MAGKGNELRRRALLTLVLAVFLTAFFIFLYPDMADTLDNAMLLGDCICDGHALDFYAYAAEQIDPATNFSANYSALMYLLFLIWNLPTFILYRAAGLQYLNSALALLWAKGMVLAAVGCCAYWLRRLMIRLGAGEEISRQGVLMLLCNSAMLLGTVFACQYDAVALSLILAALDAECEGKTSKSLILFAVAIPLKSYVLFALIPIILLREKNVLRILLLFVIMLLPSFLIDLPFRSDPYFRLALGTQNRDTVNKLLDAGISLGTIQINLFVCLYVALCVWCYCYRRERSQAPMQTILYVYGCSMFAWMLPSRVNPYWIVLGIPCLVLIALSNRRRLVENLLLLTIGTVCYTVASLGSGWLFQKGLVDRLVLTGLHFPASETLRFADFPALLAQYNLTRFLPALHTVYVVSVLILLAINFPERAAAQMTGDEPSRRYLWLFPLGQTLANIALIGLILFLAVSEVGLPMYRYDESAKLEPTVYLHQVGEIVQRFTAEKDDVLDRITLQAVNGCVGRAQRDMLDVRITDDADGTLAAHKVIGLPFIPNKQLWHLDVGAVPVKAGHTYSVHFSVVERPHSSRRFQLYSTQAIPEGSVPMEIDGAAQQGCLAIIVQ